MSAPSAAEARQHKQAIKYFEIFELGIKSDFPDGGLRAWSVAAGAAGLMFYAFGYVNSFGVFFLFSGTFIGGPLFDRYGSVLWPSAFLSIFSVMMNSLCKEYYQFLLTLGIVGGITSGMIMAPGLAAVSHYFFHDRGAALEIVVSSSSLGGVIFPIALMKMLNTPSLGFGWSVRICAFLMLGILLPSCAAVRSRLPPRKKAIVLWSAFRNPLLASTVLCNFFLVIGLFIRMYYLPTYAERAHGMSQQLCLYLHLGYGRLNVLGISGLATGIMCFCWTRAHSVEASIVFSVTYGFPSGAVVSMLSACFFQIPNDPRDIGTYIGMGMFCAALGALIGTPISGVRVSQSGGSETAWIFSGVVTIVGSFMVLVVKLLSGKGVWCKS
ncbi:major facilitator superfamily domain-containing protein [Aspergillus pseudotamarii]|uniref:Major facilitator superfamily domain-containing protein n=1 Tax=Aspergillus pseudotamarii TaxID=132259 RepID=A0A5N6SSW4_ASPPS|nr:major facilitator superfamily domain-containing protein [Aspergillus pseudotamarii]KAE8137776.1 major facilitator superfamily domain-containing protein [Aspergillus pseudotamarii]